MLQSRVVVVRPEDKKINQERAIFIGPAGEAERVFESMDRTLLNDVDLFIEDMPPPVFVRQ